MGEQADWQIERMLEGKSYVGSYSRYHGHEYGDESTQDKTLTHNQKQVGAVPGEPSLSSRPVALKKRRARGASIPDSHEVGAPSFTTPKEEVNMNNVTENGQLKQYVAVVNFVNGHTTKDYDFLCDIPLKDKDLVVVDTSEGPSVARVVGIKRESRSAIKWVIDRVDTEAYDKRRYAAERTKELEAAMNRELQRMDKTERFRKAAVDNPSLRAMLDEYEALQEAPAGLQLETVVDTEGDNE